MKKQQISQSQLRGYQTLKALFGHEITGIECNTLAQQLGSTRSQVFKDLTTLEAAGLAEQLPNKNWRVSPQLSRQITLIINNFRAAKARIDETWKRYGCDDVSDETIERYCKKP